MSAFHSSLVALDELGRGTATLDGAAIAGAVLQTLASGVHCRGLFATHYHHLSDVHEVDPDVAVMHMGCAVAASQPRFASAETEVEVEKVTFLYKLTAGVESFWLLIVLWVYVFNCNTPLCCAEQAMHKQTYRWSPALVLK